MNTSFLHATLSQMKSSFPNSGVWCSECGKDIDPDKSDFMPIEPQYLKAQDHGRPPCMAVDGKQVIVCPTCFYAGDEPLPITPEEQADIDALDELHRRFPTNGDTKPA